MELLTAAETAKRIRASKAFVYSEASKGNIPHVRISPKILRFPADELDRYLEARTVIPSR